MKTLFSTLLIACLVLFGSVSAQDHVFKVLASKGCTLKQGSEWTALTRGANLQKTSEVKIAEGGYAALLHVTGKTLELKTPGVYKADDLSGKISTKSMGFSQKYAMFAMNQISSGSTTQQSMNVTGAVTRGGGLKKAKTPISIIAPESMKVDQSAPLNISWVSENEIPAYKVEVLNDKDEVVVEKEVTENNVVLDISELDASTGLTIKVIDKADAEVSSATHKIEVIEKETASQLAKDVAEIEAAMDKESAADNFMLATVFEEQGMLMDAMKYYKKAMSLSGEIKDYEVAYSDFLKRHEIAQ